jgi:antitoxin ParD1/3/4
MSINVSLPVELEHRVREHVASGLYGSASEVIREALRLFEAYQSVQATSLQALQGDIALGLADVRSGRVSALNMNEIKAQGRAALQSKAKR